MSEEDLVRVYMDIHNCSEGQARSVVIHLGLRPEMANGASECVPGEVVADKTVPSLSELPLRAVPGLFVLRPVGA